MKSKRKSRKKTLEIKAFLDVRGQRYACEDAERRGKLELYIRVQKRLQSAERKDTLISAKAAQRIKCAFCRAGVMALPHGIVLPGSRDVEIDHGPDVKFKRGQSVVR